MAIQRITGTNSGLDVDALVKASMTRYQNKVDKETQNKKVLEYQQEQYKQIMSDASGFYDKYFDILKTGNLMSTATYNTVSFTSSDSDATKVTAKGFAGADVSGYKVAVTQLASKATTTLTTSELTTVPKLSITMGTLTTEPITVGSDINATVSSLNKALQAKGINASAKYSEFSGGIIIQSGNMGASQSFTVNELKADGTALNPPKAAIGTDIAGAITKDGIATPHLLSGTSNTVTIDNVQFSLKALSTADTTTLTDLKDLTDLTNLTDLTDLKETDSGVTLSNGGKTITSSDGNTTTTDDGTTITTTNGITTTKTTKADGTKTTTTGTKKTTTTADGTITTADGTKTTTRTVDGTTTTIDGTITTKTTTDGTILTTTTDVAKTYKQIKTEMGTNGSIKKTLTKQDNSSTVNTYTPASLTGTTDVTALKDKIVGFVNDYNTLLKSINTKIFETRDKDYMPLTDAQKEKMTDNQITNWEKKAQAGLLRRDSDLERVTSAMKSAMSSVMSGSGLYLEKIGINPVKDYTDKNGMFTIDESKLTKALEENAGNVKDLLTRSANAGTKEKGGVLNQLAAALKGEFKTSTSVLSKKVGLAGSSTEYNNTLTDNIYKKKKLISSLNSALTVRENALYKKYSNLETAMQKLNSQQSSLTSMLGQK